MRRQANKMHPKTANSPKADSCSIKGEETKSHIAELLEMISRETEKQINKIFGKLTKDVSNKVLDQINKLIRKAGGAKQQCKTFMTRIVKN